MNRRETIVEILKRELRLVCWGSDICERCGLTVDEAWKIKDGNIEHCAKLIDEALTRPMQAIS